MKLLFTLWLIHPEFLGAMYLYCRVNDDLYERHRETLLVKLHLAVSKVTSLTSRVLFKLSQGSSNSATKAKAPTVAEIELTNQAWLQRKLMQRFNKEM